MALHPLEQQFLRGIEMAQDPLNAHAYGIDAVRVTTIYSPWMLRLCLTCRHTFREHDTVRPDPEQPERMRHFDAQGGYFCTRTSCSIGAASAPNSPESTATREAFLRGLQAYWQPTGGVSTILVTASSPLVGRKCPICRHTVRLGDAVVLCPCGHDCGGVFHQDLLRHLSCWDGWNRVKIPTHCAFTGAALKHRWEEKG